jgi:hypothetical protein
VTDPWAFGWTQLLTILGFIITIGIAFGGFRTFGRWRREQLEERRIDIALEALSVAHESKAIFARIREPNGFEAEWKSMPTRDGESETDRSMRGGPYATLVRLSKEHDYFDRVARLQPKAVAVFGQNAESAFDHFAKAENFVRDSANQLTWHVPPRPEKPTKEGFEQMMTMRGDLWTAFRDPDRVENELAAFRSGVERTFRPILGRKYSNRTG